MAVNLNLGVISARSHISACSIGAKFTSNYMKNGQRSSFRQRDNFNSLRRIRCDETRALFQKEMLLLWLFPQKVHFPCLASFAVSLRNSGHYSWTGSGDRDV